MIYQQFICTGREITEQAERTEDEPGRISNGVHEQDIRWTLRTQIPRLQTRDTVHLYPGAGLVERVCKICRSADHSPPQSFPQT